MDEYLTGSGYLADGSDMEQSFNYNPSLLGALTTFLTLAENPIAGVPTSTWPDRYRRCRDYRSRFLAVLALPDERLPSIGCGNNVRASRGAYYKKYQTHYGVHTDKATLGWVALETEPGTFTPPALSAPIKKCPSP